MLFGFRLKSIGAAEVGNYATHVWAIYERWLEIGVEVCADEKSSLVIFCKEFEAEPDLEDANDDGRCVARRQRCGKAAHQAAARAPHHVDLDAVLARLVADVNSVRRSGNAAGSNRTSTTSPRDSIKRPIRFAKSSGKALA